MRRFYFFVAFLLLFLSANASSLDYDRMYDAYLANDMDFWGKEIDRVMQNNLTLDEKLAVMNFLYGYVPVIVKDDKKKKEAEHYIDLMDSLLTELECAGKAKATCKVYRVSMFASQIELNKWKLMTLGPKSLEYVDEALKLEPHNPLALGVKGNTLFYAPKALGGNKKESLHYMVEALEEFDKLNNPLYKWNRTGLQLCLAQAYDKLGEKQKAIDYCKKILSETPNFVYVRDVYLPSLLK